MSSSNDQKITIKMNRFHRLALWCQDCDSYWQLPNYLVVFHGRYDDELLRRLIKINLYLYSGMLRLDKAKCFGENYDFETELRNVFDEVKMNLRSQSKDVKILDVDIVSCLEENMSSLVDFVVQMKSSFDLMSVKVLEYSPKNFLSKLDVLRKNITRSLAEDGNLKCALDNLMDLNISGLDTLVQCVGIIFNCFYILCIELTEPDEQTPGVVYCRDPTVVIERLANISAQNYLYKYKRRWLLYYRELLSETRCLFDAATYAELSQSGNFSVIENALYEALIVRNTTLYKELTILRHMDRYPKTVEEVYGWWSGRTKEQMKHLYSLLDDTVSMDKRSTLLPFILTRNMPAKDRMFHDIYSVLKMFDRINPELSTAIGFILRIYPEVYEQVYFPDREKYMSATACSSSSSSEETPTDVLDNIRDKNTLRRCENNRCQQKNGGKNVVWNLNTFEVGKHSMNTVFKELIKNPRIFEEIFAYANKNLNVSLDTNSFLKKTKKIVYK